MDLSDQGVRDFLGSLDPGSTAVVKAMIATEDWVLDNEPEVKNHIGAFGGKLDNMSAEKLQSLSASRFLELMGSMNTGRTLCLLSYLEQRGEMGTWIVNYASSARNKDEASGLLLDRLTTMSRIRVMSQVFSPENVEFVKEALNIEFGE